MTTEVNISVSAVDPAIIYISVSDVIASAGGGGGTTSDPTVLFEGIVGGETILTGTSNSLTGFTVDSDTVTLEDFVGKRVEIQRGGQDTPTIGSYAGFTKDIDSDSILLATQLQDGEYLKIKTIP